MSQSARQDEAEGGGETLQRLSAYVLTLLRGARSWSAEHPWRGAAIGGALLGMIVVTLLGWVYLSSLAVVDVSLELADALQAWDERDLDRAKELVRELQNRPDFDELVGGALFILGGVKAQEAEQQWSAARRQLDYLIASRYLEEARSYGFPASRETEGLYWLGRSLVASHQLPPGIKALGEALTTDSPYVTSIHQLLSRAYLELPDPEPDDALRHVTAALEDQTMPASERAQAILTKTKILLAKLDLDQAQATLDEVPQDINTSAWIELLKGRILLERAAPSAAEPPTAPQEANSDLPGSIDEARKHLLAARAQDRSVGPITRQAMYYLGRANQAEGDVSEALRQFGALRKSYGSSPEGVAASLSEGELLQAQQEDESALLAYRRVLESVSDPTTYSNPLLPLSELRGRVQRAVTAYVDGEHFETALAMLGKYQPLFDSVVQSQQQAAAYEQWSEVLGNRPTATLRESEQLRKEGRLRRRQAGACYERLAKLRFATRHYPDDLWNCADCYYLGQSYTNASRILDEYLKHEPERRNPQALLRLSQSHLAMGDVRTSIVALEECIEFHPRDEAVYQARIDLSRSHRLEGNLERAEELLLDNLTRSRLTPRSPEWRESLFEMGSLLHDVGRYNEAIDYLERYLRRLDQSRQQFDDPRLTGHEVEFQELSADYLIGDSHRLAASDPLEKLSAARSQGERDKIRKTVDDELLMAEKKFQEVVIKITTRTEGYRGEPLLESMLRNSYMMLGSVLFDQGKYKEASEVYSNVSSLYQHSPFVLETYVQIAHCWRRMNQPERAKGMIQSAQFVLDKLPADADYLMTTTFSRDEWQSLINEMANW